MKTLDELKNTSNLCVKGRCAGIAEEHEVYVGFVSWPDISFTGRVIFGFNESDLMEHVSIRPDRRWTPTWEIMCRLKDMFWRPEEMVVQIHPAKERYFHGIGKMNNVLHLWRPKDGNFESLNHPELWD